MGVRHRIFPIVDRTALVFVFAAVGACAGDRERQARPPAERGEEELAARLVGDAVDPESGRPASCRFLKVAAFPEADSLMHEFAARAARGDVALHDPWLAGAVDCIGHEPVRDTFVIVTAYETRRLTSRIMFWPDTVRYLLEFRTVGSWTADGFVLAAGDTASDTITVLRTRFGNRIRTPAPRSWLLFEHAQERGWVEEADTAALRFTASEIDAIRLAGFDYVVEHLRRRDSARPICFSVHPEFARLPPGRGQRDPSDAMLRELRRRFGAAARASECKPVTDLPGDPRSVDVPPADRPMFARAGAIRRLARDTAEVGLSTFLGPLDAWGFFCTAVREGGTWRITACGQGWIS